MDRYLARLQREIDSVIAGLSPEQLTWHPQGKWCATEILEHLYLTYTGTSKGFARLLESGTPSVRKLTWKDRARSLVVLGFGYLPVGRESPPFARPRGLAPEKVVSEIGLRLAEMDQVMTDCTAKFGQRKVLEHPFLGPFSVEQWRKFHLVHGLHHIKQIRRLREHMR